MKSTNAHNTNKLLNFVMAIALVLVATSTASVSAHASEKKEAKKVPITKPKPPVMRPKHTVCILLPQLCNK